MSDEIKLLKQLSILMTEIHRLSEVLCTVQKELLGQGLEIHTPIDSKVQDAKPIKITMH